MLLQVRNVEKRFGERLLFRIDELTVYPGDRIGLIGVNGAGKTTLLNILAGTSRPDRGQVDCRAPLGYVQQLSEPVGILSPAVARQYSVPERAASFLSGGEQTRVKLAQVLERDPVILLADEPTANLDGAGINLVIEHLKNWNGAVIVVSHDRDLLNEVCTRIWEIDEQQIKVYSGGYDAYREQKRQAIEEKWNEYHLYEREKRRLVETIRQKKESARNMRKTPKRMGNSEARLHKRAVNGKRAKVEGAAKALESRLEQLPKKEKPEEKDPIRISLASDSNLPGRTLIRGENVCQAFGQRVLFDHANFTVFNGDKIAVMGKNGSGKTTLMKMILHGYDGIIKSANLRIGFFYQDLRDLNLEQTVLENVLQSSPHPEHLVRTILARLLFAATDLTKPVGRLSGGERVRCALAKIILQGYNVLILDEPTNYLDISAQEALEEVLAGYEGTLLLVSHQRTLIRRVARSLFIVENGAITRFDGSYDEYSEVQRRHDLPRADADNLLLLENRLADLMARLSYVVDEQEKEELDAEFQRVARSIRQLKSHR